MFFKVNDDTTTDGGKTVDIQRDSSTRKRPLITDDVDDTERKGPNQLLDWATHVGRRQRQKFIDSRVIMFHQSCQS